MLLQEQASPDENVRRTGNANSRTATNGFVFEEVSQLLLPKRSLLCMSLFGPLWMVGEMW